MDAVRVAPMGVPPGTVVVERYSVGGCFVPARPSPVAASQTARGISQLSKFMVAALAAVLTIGAFAMPTEAATNKYRSDGWHIFTMNQRTASTVLKDRSPDRAKVVIALQK